VNSSDTANRWAVPQRRWQRPTWRDTVNTLLLVVVLAGTVLGVTGDITALIIGVGSMLGGFITNHYRAEDEAPYAKRFSQPPDAATQRLIHDDLAGGRLPVDAALREVALDYACGWSSRLKRFLLLAPLVAAGWCLVCVVVVWWFNHRWPESTSTRTWGLTIVMAGAVCWLVCFVPPAVRQRHRLHRLHRLA
jgi:hypothetical protein